MGPGRRAAKALHDWPGQADVEAIVVDLPPDEQSQFWADAAALLAARAARLGKGAIFPPQCRTLGCYGRGC